MLCNLNVSCANGYVGVTRIGDKSGMFEIGLCNVVGFARMELV